MFPDEETQDYFWLSVHDTCFFKKKMSSVMKKIMATVFWDIQGMNIL